MYHFDSDYMEGAHPAILERLTAINFDKHDGYGCDSICDSARARIREACGVPGAEVHLLTGGTQTNATMIKALLRPFEGAVAADTGHINIHEAGAVEATGHKVRPLPHTDGKLCAETVARYIDDFRADGNRDHMVWPGMVYISQPTEYGTLYTLYELEALSRVCRRRSIPLYMDGARLGYALAAPACDMTLRDVARLCDIFYIGGTKCGALLGEAVVIPRAGLIPHLFTTIKQPSEKPRVIMEFADIDLAHGLFTGTASTLDEMCRGTIYLSGMISMADNLNRILDRVSLYLA